MGAVADRETEAETDMTSVFPRWFRIWVGFAALMAEATTPIPRNLKHFAGGN